VFFRTVPATHESCFQRIDTRMLLTSRFFLVFTNPIFYLFFIFYSFDRLVYTAGPYATRPSGLELRKIAAHRARFMSYSDHKVQEILKTPQCRVLSSGIQIPPSLTMPVRPTRSRPASFSPYLHNDSILRASNFSVRTHRFD
jgi:hypothetical protein